MTLPVDHFESNRLSPPPLMANGNVGPSYDFGHVDAEQLCLGSGKLQPS
jgi:hypothetical protein